MEAELAVRIREGGYASKPAMQLLEESLSTGVQMSEGRGALAESVAAEMEQLMRLYVEPLREKKTRRLSGRAAIVNTMRGEFERAGVWDLMRKRIAASEYTRPGDPLRLDCGYRFATQSAASEVPALSEGLVRIFQAVSLDGDLEAAKVLSYSAARLRAGVARVERAALDLAAVVEPLRSIAGEDPDAADRYRFGVETMEEADIRVVTVSDLARVAETAKRELRV